jgi:hypothetical protein
MSKLLAVSAALVLTACAQEGLPVRQDDSEEASTQEPSAQDWQAAIDKSEHEWAALATTRDPAVLERILASDYVGTADDGTVFDKAQEIRWETEQPDEFVAATPPAMDYRRLGDTVIARGQQTLTPKAGGAPVKILWTDVWMLRDGKWQVVGSQNATVPPKG